MQLPLHASCGQQAWRLHMLVEPLLGLAAAVGKRCAEQP